MIDPQVAIVLILACTFLVGLYMVLAMLMLLRDDGGDIN